MDLMVIIRTIALVSRLDIRHAGVKRAAGLGLILFGVSLLQNAFGCSGFER
jgi:hydrogenase/urease accessory protein HupE